MWRRLFRCILFGSFCVLFSNTASPTPAPSSIRSTSNKIGAYVGTGTSSDTGDGGKATAATIKNGRGLWIDANNYFYVVEFAGCCVRRFSTVDMIIGTFAGICGTCTYGGDNGPATSASFVAPVGVISDTNGKVFIADTNGNRIRLLATTGIASTYCGTGGGSISGDNGPASSAAFVKPQGLWINSVADVYAASYSNFVVRKIAASPQIITTIAGKTSICICCLIVIVVRYLGHY